MIVLLTLLALSLFYYNSLPFFRYIVDRYIFTKILNPNNKKWVFVKLTEDKEVYIGYILKKIDEEKYIVKLYTNIKIKNILISKDNIIKLTNNSN